MARGVFSTANYFELASGIITATPLTIAAWVKPASFPANQYIAGIFYTSAGSGTAQDGWVLEINATNGVVNAIAGNGTGINIASSASGASSGAWSHMAAKFVSTTSRYAYLNGTPGSQNTGSNTPSTAPDKTIIGVLVREDNSKIQAATQCHIAEVGYWNTDLTDAEIAILAKGVSPLLVRPANLVAYYPLVRGDGSGDEPSLKNAAHKMVEQGTISVQPHTRVFMPNPPRLFKHATAAPTGWSNLVKVNGVLSSSLAKSNGIAVASISKIDGISV